MSLASSAAAVSAPAAPAGGEVTACEHCGLPVPVTRRVLASGAPQFCCFGCHFAYELARPASGSAALAGQPANTLLLRLGLGVFLTMNIMAFSGLFYSPLVYGSAAGDALAHDALQQLIAYFMMLLATCVLVMLGTPLLTDVLGNLRRGAVVDVRLLASAARRARALSRKIDANLLICVGVGAAFLISVIHTLRAHGELYYDTAALILTLVTLGHYLDSTAKRKATSAAASLLASVPTRAWVRRNNNLLEVEAAQLRIGDRLRVRPGETIPVDGVVAEGAGFVNESSLTGESKPRATQTGDGVLAGSISVDGQLWIDATQVGDDRTIAQTQRLLEAARQQQLPMQRIVDRIAAVFVPGVVLLAIGVFAFHASNGDATTGLFDALAVLLISCPCALGLAAPLATWSALHRAARRGILIDSAVTLERAAAITRVFFDKTGTLTEPTLRVQHVQTFGGITHEAALRIAAAVESSSVHPIAWAIVDEAARVGCSLPPALQAQALPGLGVQAQIDGRTCALGWEKLVRQRGLALDAADRDGAGVNVYLMNDEHVLARFTLAEAMRADARQTVAALRAMGIEATILTGDDARSAHRVASALSMSVESSLLPADKLDHLVAQRDGHGGGRVAMVGDGINDAPVLAAADVGFALRCGANLAQQAGNVRLLSDRLDRVPMTIGMARHCMRRVRLNLVWAFGYNTIGLALAAGGYLNPIFAASAMFVSSILIVTTSRSAGNILSTVSEIA